MAKTSQRFQWPSGYWKRALGLPKAPALGGNMPTFNSNYGSISHRF